MNRLQYAITRLLGNAAMHQTLKAVVRQGYYDAAQLAEAARLLGSQGEHEAGSIFSQQASEEFHEAIRHEELAEMTEPLRARLARRLGW